MTLLNWLLLPFKAVVVAVALLIWIVWELMNPSYEDFMERDMTE